MWKCRLSFFFPILYLRGRLLILIEFWLIYKKWKTNVAFSDSYECVIFPVLWKRFTIFKPFCAIHFIENLPKWWIQIWNRRRTKGRCQRLPRYFTASGGCAVSHLWHLISRLLKSPRQLFLQLQHANLNHTSDFACQFQLLTAVKRLTC